jgi:hypothetical protein
VETVLGLSVTSSSVGWVVLDGSGPGAGSLDHDEVDVAGLPADDISRHIGAVRGAQAIAAASGQDLTSIGVAWTAEAVATANLVLRELPALGFHKVVPVRLTDAGEHVELTLAWAAALAVASNVATVPVPVLRREPVAAVQPRKNSWLAPTRAAVVLVAGLSALFVAGPELAGQAESPTPEIQSAADAPAVWESVYAVAVPAAEPPAPVTVQLVAGRPTPAPNRAIEPAQQVPTTSYAAEEATPVVAEVAVPEPAVSTESVAVPHMPGQQMAAPSPISEPAPTPVMPPPDPAQLVFSPLLGALP